MQDRHPTQVREKRNVKSKYIMTILELKQYFQNTKEPKFFLNDFFLGEVIIVKLLLHQL